ncbi:MAG TPA: M1 family metallopeptidase [Flavobacteriales bacterium]|nr:M1 family metallopeptidase [Flavobacteriales bacterium]
MKHLPLKLTVIASVLFFPACQQEPGKELAGSEPRTYVMDPHSYARPEDAAATHLSLDIHVDMEHRQISGTATYDLHRQGGDSVIFDTYGLTIEQVTLGDGSAAQFTMGEQGMLGQALRVALPPGADRVSIKYSTGPDAKALQWLSPVQTGDKKHPFLFTQGEAILTRSWIPIQDSPGIRITYDAHVTVPPELMAIMSATNPQERSNDGSYRFRMDKAIPPYLIALAVGDIHFKATGKRTGVYAERGMVDTAAWELADMEKMVEAAEALYGPYRWGRYDVVVLPPSFPFGGMENPCLTFATPTIIAGDRTLTSLIAHELAHSWSGNLVTNATWNDFWLNEGFTVYFEHRITEALYGKDYNDMTTVLGYQDLLQTLAEIDTSKHPEDSALHLDLEGRDPDDGMTDIAYEKGYALLRLIESKVGRAKFDAFLRGYFDHFAFKSITTDTFKTYIRSQLLEPEQVDLNLDEWIDKPGLPGNVIVPSSEKFAEVDKELDRWGAGTAAKDLSTQGWNTFQWMHFLRHLPQGLIDQRMDDLDRTFQFSRSGNAEIQAAWLEQCAKNGYVKAFGKLEDFLTTVGRRKFLVPLYQALMGTEKGREVAVEIYAKARPNYHSVSVRTIDDMLNWKEAKPAHIF